MASGRFGGKRIGGTSTGQGFRLLRSKARTEGVTDDGTDITLPAGVDALTVWVRFESPDPNAEVGLMGVGLEDITPTQ